MALKNYTTTVPAIQSAAEIEVALVQRGARSVIKEYGDNGKIVSMSFGHDTMSGYLPFRLPANVDPVLRTLQEQRRKNSSIKATPEQAERVAWRNLRDWVLAQLALYDTRMVKFEQIFLSEIVDQSSGKTFFEVVENRQFLLTGGSGQ